VTYAVFEIFPKIAFSKIPLLSNLEYFLDFFKKC